jgi:glycerophosphoryl diester phosphodiesterase
MIFNIFIILASAYLVLSILLFFFPNIIHKKKYYQYSLFNDAINGKRIIKIAHRGGPRVTTENTLEAFRKVVKTTDMIELDVCMTKDNVLVVHHDHDLMRTCGSHKKIN